jgi:hypothetical protein
VKARGAAVKFVLEQKLLLPKTAMSFHPFDWLFLTFGKQKSGSKSPRGP